MEIPSFGVDFKVEIPDFGVKISQFWGGFWGENSDLRA